MNTHFRILPALSLALMLAASGCSEGSPVGTDDGNPSPMTQAELRATALGKEAFTASCATCHASRDGLDLALFRFSERDIFRRAVFHVDSTTAQQIVRYVRSIDVPSVSPDRRPFQVPRVASDVDFARRLFGGDRWPAGLDEAALLKIDPAKVAAAIDFPRWSDESSDLDWMGNAALPESVLAYNDSSPRRALAAYYADRSDARLITATSRLRAAAFDSLSGACAQTNDGAIRVPLDCFEQLRWISNLGAQHVLRRGMTAAALPSSSTLIQNTWWDVGQAARRSLIRNRTPIPDAEGNWVSWMYLGWVLAPASRASIYTASGLTRVGLPRHATFVAVRSLVARPANSASAHADLRTTVRVAPMDWLPAAAESAVGALEERHARGWNPESPIARQMAIEALDDAARTLTRRLGTTKAAGLVDRITRLKAL